MSTSTTPDSSFTQEKNDKNPTLKLSLKGQPTSLPNLFESLNLQEGKTKPYSSQNKAVRSRVKSFEGRKIALDPVLAKKETSPIGSNNKLASTTPNSSFTQERNNKNPTLKLSLKGQPRSLPNLFESMNLLEDRKPKPYSSQNKAVRSRVKSFEGKKVALNPVLTKIEGLKLTFQTKNSPPLSSLRISNTDEDMKKSKKAISSNYKSRSQLYQELKETKANFLASKVGYFSKNAFTAKMGADYGLSNLCLSDK